MAFIKVRYGAPNEIKKTVLNEKLRFPSECSGSGFTDVFKQHSNCHFWHLEW